MKKINLLKNNCPQCGEKSFSFEKKFFLTWLTEKRIICNNCGHYAKYPSWVTLLFNAFVGSFLPFITLMIFMSVELNIDIFYLVIFSWLLLHIGIAFLIPLKKSKASKFPYSQLALTLFLWLIIILFVFYGVFFELGYRPRI